MNKYRRVISFIMFIFQDREQKGQITFFFFSFDFFFFSPLLFVNLCDAPRKPFFFFLFRIFTFFLCLLVRKGNPIQRLVSKSTFCFRTVTIVNISHASKFFRSVQTVNIPYIQRSFFHKNRMSIKCNIIPLHKRVCISLMQSTSEIFFSFSNQYSVYSVAFLCRSIDNKFFCTVFHCCYQWNSSPGGFLEWERAVI